jgi:hypothetical protein
MPTRCPSQVRVSGPLAPYADGFRAALDAQGFSPWSQMFYLHLLADVSRWLGRHGLDASGLTDANASEFRQDRRSRGLARGAPVPVYVPGDIGTQLFSAPPQPAPPRPRRSPVTGQGPVIRVRGYLAGGARGRRPSPSAPVPHGGS